jgi:hypothetical protein
MSQVSRDESEGRERSQAPGDEEGGIAGQEMCRRRSCSTISLARKCISSEFRQFFRSQNQANSTLRILSDAYNHPVHSPPAIMTAISLSNPFAIASRPWRCASRVSCI